MIDTDIDLCKWMNYNKYKNSNTIIKMIYIEGDKQICNKNPRVLELVRKANVIFGKKCEDLGWAITVYKEENAGSYIEFYVAKGQIKHSVAYLYSQSTNRQIYDMLAKSIEVIFIHGIAGYDLENTFSKNCPIQVLTKSDFLYVLTDWNMKYLGTEPINDSSIRHSHKTIHIIEEDPLKQIYIHLNALTSRTVAEETIHLNFHIDESKVNILRASGRTGSWDLPIIESVHSWLSFTIVRCLEGLYNAVS